MINVYVHVFLLNRHTHCVLNGRTSVDQSEFGSVRHGMKRGSSAAWLERPRR